MAIFDAYRNYAEEVLRSSGGALIGPTPVGADIGYDPVSGLLSYRDVNDEWQPVLSSLDFWRSGVGGIDLPDGTADLTENIRRDGFVGINTDPVASLDVNGAVINRAVTLANFAANAAMGTAAVTVDIASVILIPQSTTGISVTIPSPTAIQSGRHLCIVNTGSVLLLIVGSSSIVVDRGVGVNFIWNGSSWNPVIAPSNKQHLNVTRAGSNQTLFGAAVDAVFDRIIAQSDIAYNTTTGVATLTAGKTYSIRASLGLGTFSNATAGQIRCNVVDATSNLAVLANSTGLRCEPLTSTNGNGPAQYFEIIYKPTTNQAVKVRCLGATGTASLGILHYSGMTIIEI